jgi:DnaK suppressor protein
MPIHMADIGTDNFEQEFALGLMDSERKILAEINDALGRIDEGVYGTCEGTGKPIAKARLEANPWARYCIKYATMVEQGLVREGEKIDEEPEEEYEADDELDELEELDEGDEFDDEEQ